MILGSRLLVDFMMGTHVIGCGPAGPWLCRDLKSRLRRALIFTELRVATLCSIGFGRSGIIAIAAAATGKGSLRID